MKAGFLKAYGGLVPAEPNAQAWLDGTKQGQFVEITATRPRNGAFHRKFFALLNYAFENWDIPEGDAEKNFDRFRDEITIMAGFYDKVWTVSGDMRLVAQSISFAKMTEIRFQGLYSKVVQVILDNVLTTHTDEDIDRVLNDMNGFL